MQCTRCQRAPATSYPVIVLHAAGVPPALYGPARLLYEVPFCTGCAERTRVEELIDADHIGQFFAQCRHRAPDIATAALRWVLIGTKDARTLFDASEYPRPERAPRQPQGASR